LPVAWLSVVESIVPQLFNIESKYGVVCGRMSGGVVAIRWLTVRNDKLDEGGIGSASPKMGLGESALVSQ
jgi:hypothetical protein